VCVLVCRSGYVSLCASLCVSVSLSKIVGACMCVCRFESMKVCL